LGPVPIHLHGWSLFSKCCPNQPIEKANLDKCDSQPSLRDQLKMEFSRRH
jgi:hypothetical protein